MTRLAGTVVLLLLMSLGTFAQEKRELFEDPEGKYTLALAPGWIGIVSKDGLGRVDVKIVYKVTENGALRIRRNVVEEGMPAMDFAKKDEEQTLRFLPGYAKGKTEVFRGGVDGALVSWDFTLSGRPMSGRVYYIKVSPTTIFSMRFTGLRNVLGPVRNETDAMARSLKGQ
jgi:hypothetical protein